MNPQEFVNKWRNIDFKERSFYQEHFADICHLVGHPTTIEYGQQEVFSYEASADRGFADVWKRGYFAWEYKGERANLEAAYDQLLRYREALQNPPLLIVSDSQFIRIHTNFTNTIKREYELTLDDLLIPEKLDILRAAFFDSGNLRAPETPEQVTEQAAKEFAQLAELLRKWGEDPSQTAHFLIRLLFCLFAEDIGLLPKDIFTRLVEKTRRNSKAFAGQLRQLFAAMATGGWFGADEINHFDGGLFDDDFVLELDSQGIDVLAAVSGLDWSSIEPSILGTLFERSLDPGKRAQLGAHYTSREDILLIVEPVLMAPLRRRWDEVQSQARELAAKRDQADTARKRRNREANLQRLLDEFSAELRAMQVLDPACGSGNFLYVALRQLLDLWKQVSALAGELGLTLMTTLSAPSPAQLFGIEINAYAHELAQATIWIGYIQWLRENGFGQPASPILKKLDNIQHMDAILSYDEAGEAVEPEWPQADVVIGNPPFLGGKRLRAELGDQYIDQLFELYHDSVPKEADLVCYWFERVRKLIEKSKLQRAGLLATQGIRGGANRKVLEKIKDFGDIFWAHSDRDWILDGASVHVSMVGFDNGTEKQKKLNGNPVDEINPDLTSDIDMTTAVTLAENSDIAFQGPVKVGAFDIDHALSQKMLSTPNPHGLPNANVIKPFMNASDITGRTRNKWIIDFDEMEIAEASLYEAPFEYIKETVKPNRDINRDRQRRTYWWRLGRSGRDLKDAKKNLKRMIITPRVSKYRVFIWGDAELLPDSAVVAIANETDYFFGVLHSSPHELWALRKGTSLEDRPRYTPSTTFETFPFPWPPGSEPRDDPQVQAIAEAARELDEKRQRWLNPEGISEKELKRRTLTNLYNQCPTWLDLAHQKLDRAVLDAYGWPHDITNDEILERLLALNLERAGD